jgi:hypothetical protein
MAHTVSQRGRDSRGTIHECRATITFSGTYADEGETLVPGDYGFAEIHDVIVHGLAMASDEETAIPVSWDRTSGKLIAFEGSAAGTALTEKTAAEAYPTGCYVDVTVLGR